MARIEVTRTANPKRKRRYTAAVDGVIVTSPSGKPSLFKDHMNAYRRARDLLEQKDADAALRAEYAHLLPLPNLTLGQTLARVFA